MRPSLSVFIAGWMISVSAFGASVVAAPAQARTLTFEERVAAQRAIEAVWWNHRTWPVENRKPKPRLAEVMSDAALRAKVRDYVRESNALAQRWHRPVTQEQLQAELDRMASSSRDTTLLSEIWNALGNDPVLIAETFARQSLVERLIRDAFACDDTLQADVRQAAESAVSTELGVLNGGVVRSRTWERVDGSVVAGDDDADDVRRLGSSEWRGRSWACPPARGHAPPIADRVSASRRYCRSWFATTPSSRGAQF